MWPVTFLTLSVYITSSLWKFSVQGRWCTHKTQSIYHVELPICWVTGLPITCSCRRPLSCKFEAVNHTNISFNAIKPSGIKRMWQQTKSAGNAVLQYFWSNQTGEFALDRALEIVLAQVIRREAVRTANTESRKGTHGFPALNARFSNWEDHVCCRGGYVEFQ